MGNEIADHMVRQKVGLAHRLHSAACCRFRGYEDKIVLKELESGSDEMEVQP
jgi:hypothetical protein